MLFPEMSLVGHAIDQTRRIMEALLGSDDELTEAIADVDPRAVEALCEFLQTLADQEAVCALSSKRTSSASPVGRCVVVKALATR